MVNKKSGHSHGENWHPAQFKLNVSCCFFVFKFLNLSLDFLLSPHIPLQSTALRPCIFIRFRHILQVTFTTSFIFLDKLVGYVETEFASLIFGGY